MILRRLGHDPDDPEATTRLEHMSDVSELLPFERDALAKAIRAHLDAQGEPVADPGPVGDGDETREVAESWEAWDQDRLERFQAFLTGIPDFGAWLAERKAVEQAEREREQAMEERVRELIRVGMPWQEARELAANPPELDADVEALLEKAEIYLQQENQ
jgi:hypothetical protein